MMTSTFHRRTVNGKRMRPAFDPAASRLALERAKAALPLWEIWARLGLPNPPHRDGSCRCPWREDRTPSFSIGKGGTVWHDFTEGEGGDAVAFIMRATGCDVAAAIRQLLDFAGMGDARAAGPRHISAFLTPLPVAPRAPEPPAEKKPLPEHRAPTAGELATLCRGRGLGPSIAGLEIMARRGSLHVAPEVFEKDAAGNPCRVPACLFTDDARRCAMLRRCDGKPWECIGGRKSRTWSGEEGGSRWPVGAHLLAGTHADARLVIVTEGAPDLCAGHVLLHDLFAERPDLARAVVIVGMVSASVGMHPEALPLFAGRRVLIVPHADAKPDGSNPGESAARRWAAQLTAAGASVSIFRLRPYLPPEGKDLCDAAAHAFACEPPHDDAGEEPPALTLSRHLFAGITGTPA